MAVLDPAVAATPKDRLRHSLELIGFSLAIAYAVFLAGSAFERVWLIDSLGGIIDNDFIGVWAAGRLVLEGHPAAAYDWGLHREVEVVVAGRDFGSYYGWHYPPTFLFAAAPLATLPYLAAWAVWLAITLPAYVTAVRAIIGERIGIVLALGFPGVLWNISVGQNGFLTAALIGGTLVCLERRPRLAGICLGLLTYKPQFGLLFPLVLLADRRWSVLIAASLTAVALAVASIAAFGQESWHAFFAWMPVTGNAVFAEGRAGLMKLQSLLGLVRWLGGSMTAAWAAQGVLIAGATMLLAWLWRQSVPYEVKAAALAAAAMLATPYLYIYDFPVLMIPIAFLMRMGLRDGFLAFELPGIAVSCGLILAFPVVAMPTGFAAATLVTALIVRRAAAEYRGADRAAMRKIVPA
jgi:arabinofuranan 3-O-arabinosyltransferase